MPTLKYIEKSVYSNYGDKDIKSHVSNSDSERSYPVTFTTIPGEACAIMVDSSEEGGECKNESLPQDEEKTVLEIEHDE